MKAAAILLWLPLLWLGPEKGKKKVVYSPQAHKPIGPYSQGIESDGTLYVSGQIALTSEGTMDTATFEAECRRVLENIRLVLLAAGKVPADVNKSTVYLTDLHNYKHFNGIYAEYFPKDPPAREVVQVKGLLLNAHVEMSVIAR
jgi:2-iminobutanoate/2-iminopropanoate deaminase